MRKLTFGLFILVALLPSLTADAQPRSVAVVTTRTLVSATAIRPGDSFDLLVRAAVRPGYHIASNDKAALYPARLTVSAPKGITFSEPVYPEPLWRRFRFMPDRLPVYEGEFVITVRGRVSGALSAGKVRITTKLDSQACKDDQCFPPQLSVSSVDVPVLKKGAEIGAANVEPVAPRASEDEGVASRLAGAGILQTFALLYGGGLLLALTPCVYPMIPVTIGYFSNQAEKRRRRVALLAGAYVLGLAASYSVLGALAATTGGMIGSAMQSPGVIVAISVILVGLALSMFGLYELQAPAFVQSKASGRSGVLGALLMGLVFGAVAAPCVGPFVLGLALYVAKLGSPIAGFAMFFALAIGLGTPIFALAVFSAKLPVPGMWMVTVKKLAGFLLVGTAAYFMQFIVPESVGRLLIPAVVLAAGIYLGLLDKSLRQSPKLAIAGKAFCLITLLAAAVLAGARHSYMEFRPYSPGAYDASIAAGKPVIVDFSARWCAACRELEHGPFSDPNVIAAAKHFSRFRVDGTTRSSFVAAAEKRFGVSGTGYPAVIFIDRSGKEVRAARITGYVSSDEMIRRLRTASSR